MSQPDHTTDINELKKGLQRVGLSLSEAELAELNFGNIISLEKMELGTIGSLFILASATSAFNLGKRKQPIAFQDLPQTTQGYQECSGIPVYCWRTDCAAKRCLCLTIVDGKPAVRVCCDTPLEKGLTVSPAVLNS
jgi:hypothetical protein